MRVWVAAAVTLGLTAAACGGGSAHRTVGAPRSAPTTTDAPATTSTTVKLGTREHPMPIGVSGFLHGPYWSVTVLGFMRDASAVVAKTNPPPKPGHQFALARVRMTYTGRGRRSPGGLSLTAVGASSVVYDPFGPDSCGVYPDDYSHANDVFAGGVVEGNVCWSVRSSDVDSLLLVVEPKASVGHDDNDAVFMTLQ